MNSEKCSYGSIPSCVYGTQVLRRGHRFARGLGARRLFKDLLWTYECDLFRPPSYPADEAGLKFETHVQYLCRHSHAIEVEVYRRMHDRQGLDIPRLLSNCSINLFPDDSKLDERFAKCPGILL